MNKKKFLLLFVFCCVVPLVAAKVVLEMGWYNGGSSSKGVWQQEEVFLLNPSDDKAHWRLAVVPATTCLQHCQQALFTVQQLYVGLGRKQEHVQPVLLGGMEAVKDFEHFVVLPAKNAVPTVLQNRIVLIDQQGLALLSYAMPEQTEMANTAKAIRQDLLKLLNYDRTNV